MTCGSERYSGGSSTSWFNWAGMAGGTVEAFHEPGSLADIVRVVQDAQGAGKRIRVVGSGWAFEDIAYSSEVMVSLAGLSSVLSYLTDQAGALLPRTAGGRDLVHVEGGIKIDSLNARLAALGVAMPTLGGANGQSLVGALSTSTHGADLDEAPLCDLVRAVHLVGAGGQEYWFERASAPITSNEGLRRVLPCRDTFIVRDDEVFDAVVVGLGRFGIIYSVVVEVVPAYSLARQRTMMPLNAVMDWLRQGLDQGSFIDPLVTNLPPPAPELNVTTAGVRPRAIELIMDSRNPASVHIVRRWQAIGPDFEMAFQANPLCDAGPGVILATGAAALPLLGINLFALDDPGRLAEPLRSVRLIERSAELAGALGRGPLTPGQALAMVTNAYWEFGITSVPDLLALVVYHGQFKTQRGPSYDVMTGDPAFNSSTCYRGNSCEIIFDAEDRRYLDFVTGLAEAAPRFEQAGYISLRYSRRSRALLSMHSVSSGHAVSIEVSTLQGLRGSVAWIEDVLQRAQAAGGRPHWGQQNHLTDAQVIALYGGQVERWCAVLKGLSGDSTLFSSAFTTARGLEPRGGRSIRVEGPVWMTMPGLATDIGVGGDGSVWAIGTNVVGVAELDTAIGAGANGRLPTVATISLGVGTGFGIYRWNDTHWAGVDGGGVHIAVGPDGQPWMVNAAGEIFHRQRSSWSSLPGRGEDVAVGADGSVWLIGTNPVGGGSDFGVYQWNGTGWVGVDGGGVRIAVGRDGQPWIVNSAGAIFHRQGNSWGPPLPGLGRDIGVGADGSVWLIGTIPIGGGSDFGVYKWNGTGWVGVDGSGVRIAVGPDGQPWMLNSEGAIFCQEHSWGSPLPERGKDIAVGAEGSVWLIGTNAVGGGSDFGIYKWNGTGWDGVDGAGVRIAVGPDGQPWILNSAGAIFRRQGTSWGSPLPGLGKDIGVGRDGSVWLIGTNQIGGSANFGVYKWNGTGWDGVDGAGARIAVGPDGQPWLLNAAGEIFQGL